ncbi:Hypothetical 52.8 kDa protein in BUB1-HIP1 intergenic region, putative [Brugia malayi]|uniref:Hypothetical 52.8 kDa protein in BUB1-HIP1 intergenic region, putative n=1 Tax=Brugia malayi TaxID=6279 RepID=A0A4E9FRV8_BRUMA|nr:putative 52.8 kDa protein in BUB1-HIP1 intergenic region, putative [Brugia malayi]VIO99983.1 Hypothetical 52.8 kDa protein in BUB1-HIP1 intergenic region, putative [Brugia malayi]
MLLQENYLHHFTRCWRTASRKAFWIIDVTPDVLFCFEFWCRSNDPLNSTIKFAIHSH